MTPPPNQLPLFTFGTLMDAEVLEHVSGVSPSTLTIIPAQVIDHVQREVIGEGFPILLPAIGQVASGRLIFGLSETAMKRILFFEGDEYETAPLTVKADKTSHEALYFKDTGIYETSGKSWVFDQWLASDHSRFLEQSRDYMLLFGHMTAAEADRHW